MADHSFGHTVLTNFTDSDIKSFLGSEAMADLKENSKPVGFALNQVVRDYIANELNSGDIFTYTDMFLLLQKAGHEKVKMASLKTTLTRILKEENSPLVSVKVLSRQRAFQKR
jgi:hypothetical protein